MFREKPYVVPQKAVGALFARPVMESAVTRLAEFAKSFMEVETGFLDIEAAMGQPASIAVFEDNSWRHLTADVDRDRTANDNQRAPKSGGSVAA
jgi:hypothetical protein